MTGLPIFFYLLAAITHNAFADNLSEFIDNRDIVINDGTVTVVANSKDYKIDLTHSPLKVAKDHYSLEVNTAKGRVTEIAEGQVFSLGEKKDILSWDSAPSMKLNFSNFDSTGKPVFRTNCYRHKHYTKFEARIELFCQSVSPAICVKVGALKPDLKAVDECRQILYRATNLRDEILKDKKFVATEKSNIASLEKLAKNLDPSFSLTTSYPYKYNTTDRERDSTVVPNDTEGAHLNLQLLVDLTSLCSTLSPGSASGVKTGPDSSIANPAGP